MIGVFGFSWRFCGAYIDSEEGGFESCEVRTLEDLSRVDGLIIPEAKVL